MRRGGATSAERIDFMVGDSFAVDATGPGCKKRDPGQPHPQTSVVLKEGGSLTNTKRPDSLKDVSRLSNQTASAQSRIKLTVGEVNVNECRL